MPDTSCCWPEDDDDDDAGPEIARTEEKKAGREGQERSFRGTVSVDKGMAMKRVVWDCLWGVRRVEGDVVDVVDEGGWWWLVSCGIVRDVVVLVVGVESLEGFWEEVDGVVCCWGDEGVDWDVESWGEVGFVEDAWRLRFVGFDSKLGSAGLCAWCCGLWAGGGASALSPRGCLLVGLSLTGSVGV